MGALKHARRYACKNVLNLDCQDSIHFGIYQVMKNHLGRVSPSHFLQNILIETSNVCFKIFQISYLVPCHFLMTRRLEDSKHIKRYIFCYFP